MAALAIANSSMKSVKTAEGAMPAFCMRLPLYRRGNIQEESMYYEQKKHDGSKQKGSEQKGSETNYSGEQTQECSATKPRVDIFHARRMADLT
jgi:hypothetical protein